jgi:hypothetical protein
VRRELVFDPRIAQPNYKLHVVHHRGTESQRKSQANFVFAIPVTLW